MELDCIISGGLQGCIWEIYFRAGESGSGSKYYVTGRIRTKSTFKVLFICFTTKKRAVHNIAVYCEERYAEKISKEKSCCTDFFRKRISEFKLKEDNTMRINDLVGQIRRQERMGMTQGNEFCK